MSSTGRVPLLDENDRFPDRFAPPSVAADAAVAEVARAGSVAAASGAEVARDESVAAAERAEAVPAQVDTAMAEQVGTGGEFDTKLNATIVGSIVSGGVPFDPYAEYVAGDIVSYDNSLWSRRAAGEEIVTERVNHIANPAFVGGLRWNVSSNGLGTYADGVALVEMVTARTAGQNLLSSEEVEAGAGPWSVGVRIAIPDGHPSRTFLVSAGFGPPALSSPSTTTVTVPSGEYRDVVQSGNTAPGGKTTVTLRIQAGTGGFAAGDKLVVSRPILVQGTEAGPFFYGGSDPVSEPNATREYEWLGAQNESASKETTTTTLSGIPGQGPGWALLWSSQGSVLPAPAKPIAAFDAARVASTSSVIPFWMDRTRSKTWGASGGTLWESPDDGATRVDINTWPSATIGTVREFGNGELLVTVTPTATGAPSEIWVSQGYPTTGADATWEKKIQPTVDSVRFTSAWSIFVDGNVGLAFEYGPKEGSTGGAVGSGEFARLLHLSLDYGKTWEVILDLASLVTDPTNKGIHGHGVAWDRWWDRIWITWGDDQNGTAYSDDLGQTWHLAQFVSTVAGVSQNVGILPMRDAILFGSDIAPNGVHRITRDQGKHTGLYEIDIAFAINANTNRTALCHGLYQHTPEHIAFIAFGAETNPMASCIVATRDGKHFTKIWEDEEVQAAGQGLRSVIGPTLRGNLIARFQDSSGTYLVQGKAPY